MSKFKVGDRVRPTNEERSAVTAHWNRYWRDSKGALDNTYVTGTMGGDCVRISNKPDGSGPYWPASYFTVDTTVRKGDKFRVNVDDELGSYSNGDVFVAVQERTFGVEFYDNDGYLHCIAHEDITLVDDHGEPWDYDPRGKLRIQEGKYYRTRDGRKVGPAVRQDYWWAIDGKVYGEDGTHGDDWDTNAVLRVAPNQPDNDLIAEWTDESVTVVADPTKFKVGDRVRVVNYPAAESEWDGVSGTVKAIGPFYINADLDNGFKGALLLPSEIEHPLSTPITPGTRVLIEGVVNSINGKTAHIDIIGPDVPYNRSYPLSALRVA